MTIKVQHKRSAVAGKAPLPADLEYGEIAVNYEKTDPALYIKDSADAVRKIGSKPPAVTSDTAPANPADGDLWYDSVGGELYVWYDSDDAGAVAGTWVQASPQPTPKDNGNPPGTVIHVAMNTAPTGYLKANGALVSRATYAALFAAIGTTFGGGDGSTTFGLPDLRGLFMRGFDDGAGRDAGRALGSYQADSFASHTHGFQGNGAWIDQGGRFIVNAGGTAAQMTNQPATNAEGGAETRPKNIALLACIKF